MGCSMRCSLFSNTLRTLSTAWSRVGLHPRKFFSSSNRTDAMTKWTDERDRELLELRQQGLTMVQIAEQLGRSLGSIDGRMQRLRARSKSEPAPVSSGKSWSASEDKILMEKFKAGLNMEHILSFFPGRSIKSARGRYYKLKMGGAGVPRKASDRKRWTVEEKRRVISMILVDGLSQRVIAERLGRTRQAVRSVWLKHGRKVLPADMIEKYRGENKWTSEQDNVLIEQKKKGETYEAIQLKLPSKSVTAIASRARGLKLTVKTVSFIQGAAILKDLQAVLDGTAEFKDVKNKYSSSVTPGSLRVRLCRLR